MKSLRQSSVPVLQSILKRAAAAGLMFCGSAAEWLVTRSSSVFNESFFNSFALHINIRGRANKRTDVESLK